MKQQLTPGTKQELKYYVENRLEFVCEVDKNSSIPLQEYLFSLGCRNYNIGASFRPVTDKRLHIWSDGDICCYDDCVETAYSYLTKIELYLAPEDWFENITKPVICWVSLTNQEKFPYPISIKRFDENRDRFEDVWELYWAKAEPLTEKEIKEYFGNFGE